MQNVELIISRNFQEVTNLKNVLTAYRLLWQSVNSLSPFSFFSVCSYALYNEIFTHIFRLSEDSPKCVSFINFYKQSAKTEFRLYIDEFFTMKGLRFKDILLIATKLNSIRNKAHFHIDKNHPLSQDEIFKEANLKWDDINLFIDVLYELLNGLFNKYVSDFNPYILYTGSDANNIAKLDLLICNENEDTAC